MMKRAQLCDKAGGTEHPGGCQEPMQPRILLVEVVSAAPLKLDVVVMVIMTATNVMKMTKIITHGPA